MTLRDDYGMWARFFARPVGNAWNDFLDDIDALIVGPVTSPIITQTTATLTLDTTHSTVLCDGTSNTVTITLPTAVGVEGRVYNIKAINIDNAVTYDADGTEEVDGSATAVTLALMESNKVQSDGANWWVQ